MVLMLFSLAVFYTNKTDFTGIFTSRLWSVSKIKHIGLSLSTMVFGVNYNLCISCAEAFSRVDVGPSSPLTCRRLKKHTYGKTPPPTKLFFHQNLNRGHLKKENYDAFLRMMSLKTSPNLLRPIVTSNFYDSAHA